jgi:O-antigen/teichoic acid export membrane protein
MDNFLLKIKSFFFRNNSLRQTIAKNTFWLMMAELTTRLFKLALIIYIAKIFGAENYGRFSFALAFVGLFVMLSDLGISQIVVREFSRKKEEENVDFSSVLSLKIGLAAVALVVMVLSATFVTHDPLIRKIILILSLYAVINGFIEVFFAFFRAKQKMEYESSAKIVHALAVNSVGFYILFHSPTLEKLSYGYLFASFIAMTVIMLFFNFKATNLKLSWHFGLWKYYLMAAWPLALTGIFSNTYLNIDSIIMGCFGQLVETGWYNAAHKIILVAMLPIDLIATSFFPVLSEAYSQSKDRLQKVWNYFNDLVIFLTIPMAVGGIVLSKKIIEWVFDASFTPAVATFQILMMAVVFYFFSCGFLRMLVVCHQEKKIFKIYFLGTILNLILNFILIPKFSLYGSAVALTITFGAILFLLVKDAVKFRYVNIFSNRSLHIATASALASLLMYIFITNQFVRNLNVVYNMLVGATIYLSSFLIFYKSYFKIDIKYGSKK